MAERGEVFRSQERAVLARLATPLEAADLRESEPGLVTFLAGDYGVYCVAIEAPASDDAGPAGVSPAVHLIVHDKPQYNPGGILPVAIGMPALTAASWGGRRWWRKRQMR